MQDTVWGILQETAAGLLQRQNGQITSAVVDVCKSQRVISAGAQSGDERLRRRQTGDEFDSWDAAEPSGSSGGGSGLWPSGSGSLQGSQGLPPGELPVGSRAVALGQSCGIG